MGRPWLEAAGLMTAVVHAWPGAARTEANARAMIQKGTVFFMLTSLFRMIGEAEKKVNRSGGK
jgi:hypothetical protein